MLLHKVFGAGLMILIMVWRRKERKERQDAAAAAAAVIGSRQNPPGGNNCGDGEHSTNCRVAGGFEVNLGRGLREGI
jgi:hypothetical protein